jgi:Xaa-Pro aminopeptidase
MKNHRRPVPTSFARRLEGLRSQMADKGVDALLVSALPNVQYLTGFSSSEPGSGAALVTDRKSILFTDSRYDLQAHSEVRESEVMIVKGGAFLNAMKQAQKARDGRLGFESDSISYGQFQKLRELFPKKCRVGTSGLVEALRIVKDEHEIEQIRKAVEVGSLAYEETLRELRLGITELEVAAEIEYRMKLHGAERPAFETIVAFGENAALPHAKPGRRKLRPKEFILMDLGAILEGYNGDMTRTVFWGQAPRKAAEIYRAVLEAQLEAESAVHAGVPSGKVDGAARRVLRRYGYDRQFTHSTGHGVGREIHELPRIAARQEMRLPERAVVTVEPGVYIPGFGGVRIEDVVVVRKNGADLLTPTAKELTVL